MIDYGQEQLRREGVVVKPIDVSSVQNPGVLFPHYHDFFQVSLLSGHGHVMHDFREFEVDGDTLLFLSPGQVHTVFRSPEMKGTIVSFTREFFGVESGFLLELPFFFMTGATPWLSLEASAAVWVRKTFHEMQEEYADGQSGGIEILRSLLRILFVRAGRWHDSKGLVLPRRSDVLVRRFHQEIENHFLEWSALDPYARVLGVTANHLNDVIKEVTGRPAGEHIRARRLLDAKRLLLYSDLSVSEIGYHLGFKDPSYFSRFFRRYEKGSPAGFRRRIREKYRKNAG